MHAIERHVLIPLPSLFGLDISITNEVVLLWAAALTTLVLVTLACRRKGLVPSGHFQHAVEAIVVFIEREVVREGIGEGGRRWAPFLLALFFFILFGNLFGLVPLPDVFKPVTSNISVTSALALVVFVLTVGVGIRRKGLLGFLKRFLPEGVPVWAAVLVVPIEVISWLAKPISLAIRLFANMMVGHLLIFVFIGLEMTVLWFLKWLPLAGAVAMSCFEIFVCFIQAFIFTMLAGLYIKEAIETH